MVAADYDDDDDAPPGFCTPTYQRVVATPTAEERSSCKEGSFTGRLMNFAKHAFHKATTPLLPRPTRVDDSSSAKLPLRNRRIAANPLSKYPVAKRGEIIAMQKLGFIEAEPTEEGQQKLDAMFKGRPGDTQAMRELFVGEERRLRLWRRRGAGGRA